MAAAGCVFVPVLSSVAHSCQVSMYVCLGDVWLFVQRHALLTNIRAGHCWCSVLCWLQLAAVSFWVLAAAAAPQFFGWFSTHITF